ncbi:unnamed protein product [Rotaria socialis]|uniref:Uncharacterized protein n=1 Tax=Rotaria socialis TaxID=392032 RepID=A0A820XDT7_9BILA|nr:unnamed protein product [Rotaria socialis]
MGSNKLTTIDETEWPSPSQSPEISFLRPSATKPTITKTYWNKGKFMLIAHVTVHSLMFQIISGMKPRVKRPKSKVVERRMKELYERFHSKQIDLQK